MAHLKNFGVGNFRAIKDLYNFELAPITILTGTNSSGKSSLTKAMLLFQKSYSVQNGLPSIDRIEFTHNLQIGNFDTVVNYKSFNKEIIFELPCRFTSRCLSTIRLVYSSDKKITRNGRLVRMEIYNNDDQGVFLSYSSIEKNTGIKLSFEILYEMASFDRKKLYEYHQAVEEFDTLISTLGITNFDENNLENYPSNVVSLFNKKIELMRIAYYRHVNENDIDDELIYFRSLGGVLENLPLFDYHFVLSKLFPELSKEIYKQFKTHEFESYEHYKSFCDNQRDIIKSKAKQAKKSVTQYLRDKEIKTLNNLLFTGFKDLPHEVKVDTFHHCIQSFNAFVSSYPTYNENGQSGNKFEFSFWQLDSGIYQLFSDEYLPIPEGPTPDATDSFICIADDDLKEFIIDRSLIAEALTVLKLKNPDFYYFSNSRMFFLDYLQHRLVDSFNLIGNIFNSVSYLPSVRSDINRRYLIGENKTELQKLLSTFFNTYGPEVKSLPFVDKYVRDFGIAEKVEFIPSFDNFDSRVILHKEGREFDLADVGYGFSQLLPIILKIGLNIFSNLDIGGRIQSRVMIIEEPETNLHPKLQSQLADMLIECYKEYKVQFVIETHSEYLIRKLQYYTAKKTISPSDTQLYYFNHPDEVAKGKQLVKKINILEGGRLSDDFGQGFYDETTKLIESIWEARSSN